MRVYPGSIVKGQHVQFNGHKYEVTSIRQLDGPPNEYEIVLDGNLVIKRFDNELLEVFG